MLNLCKPFRGCSKYNITQNFTKGNHEATDFVGVYGTILLAPEDCKIEAIRDGDFTLPDDWGSMEKGYGVLMSAIANPSRKYSYWHTGFSFPVEVGDFIKRGKPVAFMGNSGCVMSGGVIVPLEIRNTPPYLGTHLHLSAGDENGNFNIVEQIDWNYEPPLDLYDRLLAIKIAIQKVVNYLTRIKI